MRPPPLTLSARARGRSASSPRPPPRRVQVGARFAALTSAPPRAGVAIRAPPPRGAAAAASAAPPEPSSSASDSAHRCFATAAAVAALARDLDALYAATRRRARRRTNARRRRAHRPRPSLVERRHSAPATGRGKRADAREKKKKQTRRAARSTSLRRRTRHDGASCLSRAAIPNMKTVCRLRSKEKISRLREAHCAIRAWTRPTTGRPSAPQILSEPLYGACARGQPSTRSAGEALPHPMASFTMSGVARRRRRDEQVLRWAAPSPPSRVRRARGPSRAAPEGAAPSSSPRNARGGGAAPRTLMCSLDLGG